MPIPPGDDTHPSEPDWPEPERPSDPGRRGRTSGAGNRADADGVTWVDASAPDEAAPPSGHAPSLLPPHASPRREPPPSVAMAVRRALIVPMLAGLVLVALIAARASSRQSLDAAISEARSVAARPHSESLARIARQRALGRSLVSLRRAQRDLVNARCESGAWCDERVAARGHSLKVAEDFLARALAWPVADDLLPASQPSALVPMELTGLEAERELLQQGRVAHAAHLPTSGAEELRMRLALVEEEIRLVRSAQP